MKVLSNNQVRKADQFTIKHQPIGSIDLMEQASLAFCQAFYDLVGKESVLAVVAGRGNNGGDAFAIARILRDQGYEVHCGLFDSDSPLSDDCQTNQKKWNSISDTTTLNDKSITTWFDNIQPDIIIDGLWGSGLDRPLNDKAAQFVEAINKLNLPTISIDIPSGLFADQTTPKNVIAVRADHTISFQTARPFLFDPALSSFVGTWQLVDIGLDQNFLNECDSNIYMVDPHLAASFIKSRPIHGHKGVFGHALCLTGSYGKAGAAILMSKACLRVGTGLVTVRTSRSAINPLQGAVPEVMVETDIYKDKIAELPSNLSAYSAVGIGPGIGTHQETGDLVETLLKEYDAPLLLDADALNIIAERSLLQNIPKGSILTPHIGEFKRLFGDTSDWYKQNDFLTEYCQKQQSIVILKGAYTRLFLPDGDIHINTSGNSGMATAGCGDVLSGMITGLMAQGYEPEKAAILGVYLHGLAGDLAIERSCEESLIAGDIVENIGQAFRALTD